MTTMMIVMEEQTYPSDSAHPMIIELTLLFGIPTLVIMIVPNQMTSNLSKIKPKLRTTGQVTGNFGRPKSRTNGNTETGLTKVEHINIVTQDEYLNRMYTAMDNVQRQMVSKQFCYNEIKKILVQRGIW